MKRVAGVALLAAAVAALSLLLYVYAGVYRRPAAATTAPVVFRVENGEAFSSVVRRLSEAGLVRRTRAIAVFAWIRGYDRRICAGTYRLSAGETPYDIIRRFVEGDIYRVAVTIPEGFMFAQIAGELTHKASVDSLAFSTLRSDSLLMRTFAIEGPGLEGYLFPDTYLVPWDDAPRDVAAMMIRRMEKVFDDRYAKRASEEGMTRHEVLTLASIVEAETRVPEELTLVSAVYHNRLRSGMRLEADPTVAYAMGGHRGRLFFKDLEIDSPYNTYKNAGLPPGPICSPGEAAIHATLFPDTTCHALYFVAQGGGRHIFSRTLREHLAAVQRVRKSREP